MLNKKFVICSKIKTIIMNLTVVSLFFSIFNDNFVKNSENSLEISHKLYSTGKLTDLIDKIYLTESG
jgi:hypothetical protein